VVWAAQIAGTTTSADIGYGIATDSSGNVFVTGYYTAALTLYNQGGTAGTTLPFTGGTDVFIAKYSSAGAVVWAARIAGNDVGYGIATDPSGNVLVTGYYGAALTLYNTGGTTGATLPFTGGADVFVAKYSSAGAVVWAAQIAGTTTSQDFGYGIATDSSGNVFVTGYYTAALTLYNQGGTAGTTLPFTGGTDVFVAKYNPDGYITNAPTPANSNVLVDATYTPSTMSPFVNGSTYTTLAGTTLATTGIYVGGPSNYFNGSISEVLVYGVTLTPNQRQAVEGYLAYKWGTRTALPTIHPFYSLPAFNRSFNPTDIPGCSLWLDAADNSTMNSTTTVTSWSDKSGLGNTMTGTATWSGSNMTFNGSTQAFSNTGYVFPISAYSMFAVYSNTTAPASTAYMNVMYGSNGYPMVGVYGSNKSVSARSVVANTGALGTTVGWAARIAGTTTSSERGQAIATDSSGNVLVTGLYGAALTLYNQGGTAGTTLPFTGNSDCFVAKYSSAGAVIWAAQIAGTTTSGDYGQGIATDLSGNVLVTGYYGDALTLYNQGPSGTAGTTLPWTGGVDCFVAKYSSAGAVLWAARIAGTTTSGDIGFGIATDSSGNVLVTGYYSAALTLYNQGPSGTAGTTLPFTGGQDCFVAKYSSAGAVVWAARIAGTTTSGDVGNGIATDSSGNVLVTGYYSAALTLYNTGGTAGTTLPFTGDYDCFVAKYSSAGAVVWAAQIAGATIDFGFGIATDSSGNVLVTGYYSAALTLYNQGGTVGTTLPFTGGSDCFVAKYSSAGAVIWAAQIAGTTTSTDTGYGIATDSSGNVLVTGEYGAALTLYNQGGTAGTTLPFTGGRDCFVAKYSSAGAVIWAAQIAGTTTSQDIGNGIATDSSGNVLVTGYYSAALTVYNQGGTAGTTLPFTGGVDCFVAKYNPDGYITAPVPASSNVLVDATYTPSTMSPFVNGTTATTLAGTTLATTGLYVGGPSNYFNGSISELLIYGANLSAAQRQQVEGYLTNKWRLNSQIVAGHPYKLIPPASVLPFFPTSITGCAIWLDGADNSTMNSTTTVTSWSDKSGLGNNMTGTATWTGSNMSFNGSTQAFSNLSYVFPNSAYSLFAVYSNTTAPASTAYMNAVYGSNGYPMLGVYDVNKYVSARSVVANTGALGATAVGWAARIAGTGNNQGNGIATDSSGNVFVTGQYDVAITIYNQGPSGTAGTTLPNAGNFIAKYSSAGAVVWAARISIGAGQGIATDSSGNVLVTGNYSAALTLYNQGPSGTAGTTLPFASTVSDCFVAKYSSAGAVVWAARISGTGQNGGYAIATDSSGNVFVTGIYGAALTVYNQGPSGTAGTTLPFTGGFDVFVAKYSSAGDVVWAARIASTGAVNDFGFGIATDSSGNVLVTGNYSAALTLYNQGPSGTAGTTLPYTSGSTCFVAKYSSAGAVVWAAQIASTSITTATAIATDSSGNVLVTGYYGGNTVTFYNQGPSGTAGTTLPWTSGNICFIAKYSSAGAAVWAARIAGTANTTAGNGIATDSSGNVLVTGYYGTAVTFYNQGPSGTAGTTLPFNFANDVFVAKYSSAGAVVWAAQIFGSTGGDIGYGIATDSSGNVLVTGYASGAVTLYNQGPSGTVVGATLPSAATNVFIAKYNPDGYITAPVPASSNVLVDVTYTPSTMSPFINGNSASTRAGTTLATTGIFVGGPLNYFNGSISELLVYASTLTTAQRQQVEGYLAQKWRVTLPVAHPYYKFGPALA
jgi:NADH dehydrogenase FAD-containing subunit